MNRFVAGGARDHRTFILEMPVGLPTQRTAEALVTLLVAAIAYRVVQVPPRAWAIAGCASSAVTAYPTVLAFPPVFWNGGHDWTKAVRMVSLVTGVAHKHLDVFTGLSARLADLAVGTLPPSSCDGFGFYRWTEAVSMVMGPTAGAEELLQHVAQLLTLDAEGVVTGNHFSLRDVVSTQQGKCLQVLEAFASRGAGEMKLLHTARSSACQGSSITTTIFTFLGQRQEDRLVHIEETTLTGRNILGPPGAGIMGPHNTCFIKDGIDANIFCVTNDCKFICL